MIKQSSIEDEQPEEAPTDSGPDLTAPPGAGGKDFGLKARNAGPRRLGGRAGGNRSHWTRYAAQMQNKIADALRQNASIRKSRMTAEVRIWADSNGRITRVTLVKSTGDATLDNALKSEALTGLQLTEAPPKDMPMPITLSLSARRPN